jgi:uncharacterized protein YndB with AHSA1/START domain
MKNKFVVRDSVKINAEPGQVWKALTDPALTKKYFFGCEVHSAWKRGSRITWKRKFLWMKFELTGTITAIEKEKLLQYTVKNRKKESGHSLVTDKLSYHNGTTTLTISDDVGSGPGARGRYRKSVRGWRKVLSGLKQVLEKKNPEAHADSSLAVPA